MIERIRNATQTIGTDATVISEEQNPPQSFRTVLYIVNTSTGGQVISISAADEAAAGKGIVITPGGFYQDSSDSGYKATNSRITAVSSAAGGTISIHERIMTQGGQ